MRTDLEADSPIFGWAPLRVALLVVFVMLVASACGQETQEPGDEQEAAFSYEVDVSLEASRAEHPRPIGGSAPLAVVETQVGKAEFVANEITVWADDSSAVESALGEMGAELVHELPFESGPSMYVLRIDPTAVSLEDFASDMRQVSPDAEALGQIVFSSDEAARTMAAAASLNRRGVQADLTWVGEPSTIANRSSAESAAGWQWGSNNLGSDAYAWAHFSATSNQATGVGEAWSLLERAGRLDNKVSIGVVDAGFCPTQDFYNSRAFNMALDGRSLLSANVLIGDLIDEALGSNPICNWADYSDMSTPGWHGLHVYSALMGRHDNEFGTTGPASPVAADPTLFVNMMYDTISTIYAINQLESEGVQIVNMSFHIPIPWGLQWSHGGYEKRMKRFFQDDGILLFAAAGNEGESVDARWTPAGVDLGEAWQYLPCEADGVICVGGLQYDGTDLHGNSNFGPNSVDITGPYVVPGGPDPDASADDLEPMGGTSFASPHVAGVAALIWAADPSMSATQVRDHLYATSLPGGYGDRVRNGYACALCAVRQLVPNTAPAIRLISPQEGSSVPESQEVTFSVDVDDIEDELEGRTTRIVWYEGGQEVHTGASFTTRKCPGSYNYRVEATDSDGATSSMEFQFRSEAAEVEFAIDGHRRRSYRIKKNLDGSLYTDTQVVRTTATHPTCSDPDSANIPVEEIEWYDAAGNLLGTGDAVGLSGQSLKDADGGYQTVELEARFDYLGDVYTDQVILSPCSSDANDPSFIPDYPACSSSSTLGDLLISLRDVLDDPAWHDLERRGHIIAGELYSDPLGQLGLCDTETCDPQFPRPLDAVTTDLYNNFNELVVAVLRDVALAAGTGELDGLDAATTRGFEAVGLLGSTDQTHRAMLERGLMVASALTEFYMPTSVGGQNGWAEMAFVTNPETMSIAQAMRPVEAGIRAYMDAATITGEANSPLNVEAAEYASIREAIRVADDAPVE